MCGNYIYIAPYTYIGEFLSFETFKNPTHDNISEKYIRSFLIFSATRNSSLSTVGAKLLPMTRTAYWNCWAASAERQGKTCGHCPAGEVPITRSSQGETGGLGPNTCPPPSPGSTREDGKPCRNQNTRVGVCSSSPRKEGETATGQDVGKILAVRKPMGLTVLNGEPGAASAQNLAWGEEASSGEPLSISPRTDRDLVEL